MSMLSTILERTKLTQRMTREQLEPFIARWANNGRTLDIGCSIARYARYFPNRVGLDLVARPGVDVVGDAHDLRMFRDGEFECVLCTEVLEHLHTPAQAIAEMHRVLAPGGTLVLTTRFIFPMHDTPHDYYRFTKYGLQHLFREFEIVELREELPTLQTIAALVQRLGIQTRTAAGKRLNAIWLLLARALEHVPPVLTVEYGNLKAKRTEDAIMTSGYYLVARRRSP